MPPLQSTRAEAFYHFETQFRLHADRVQKAWSDPIDVVPVIYKRPRVVSVTKENQKTRADAAERRNRRVLEALETGCRTLLESEFLKKSRDDPEAIAQAVNLLVKSWRTERNRRFDQFADAEGNFPETDQNDSRQASLVEQCHIKENTFWFLAGYAEAVAVFEDLIRYKKPADLRAQRITFDTALHELQNQLPQVLADFQFKLVLPIDVVHALQVLHANKRGLETLFAELRSIAFKIDATERDSTASANNIGSMRRDVMSRICYAAFQTFGTCPRDAVVQLSEGFKFGDRKWTREQIDLAIEKGIQSARYAQRSHVKFAQQAQAMSSQLWAFGRPQPLQRV